MTTLIRNPRVSSVPPDLRPRAVPPRAPAHTPPSTIADALSPLTDAQLRAQAHELVTAETKPILDEINKLNAQQSSRGQAAITGYTQALGHDLAQYMDRARAAYGPAEQSQGATDAALSSELHGGGSVVANALTSRLGSDYDPALVASLADKANQTAAGSSGAEFAKGSAERSKLIAEGGHASEYASKLPFFAELAGLQKSKDLQSQLSSDLATQTGAVTSKVPESVVSLFNDLRGREIQKQIARDSGLLNNRKVDASISAGKTKASQPDASLSRAKGYLVDANGNPIGGTVQPLPGFHVDATTGAVVKDVKPAKPKVLSPSDKTRLTKLADDLRYGVPPKQQFNAKTQAWMDVPGTGTPNSSYAEAYAQLVAAGAPEKWARAVVNRLYRPGQFGRPLTGAQASAAAVTREGDARRAGKTGDAFYSGDFGR